MPTAARRPHERIDAATLGGRILVISPHLDDGAFSLGATIAAASARGAAVRMLTVLAGNPDSDEPAGKWDAACGFRTEGEAARERREEDRRACTLLGATPEWLPFEDEQYTRTEDDVIWRAVVSQLDASELVLVPGIPLTHPDHAWLSALLLSRLPPQIPFALYGEQPYAADATVGRGFKVGPLSRVSAVALRTRGGRRIQTPLVPGPIAKLVTTPPTWVAVASNARERRAKRDAVAAYFSQLPGLGRRLYGRISVYEWGWGGEMLGLMAGKAVERAG